MGLTMGADMQKREWAFEDAEELWSVIIASQSRLFYTVSGLPFTYTVKRGRKGQLTKELIIDRQEQSKTLTWSSIRGAFERVMHDKEAGESVCYPKPKAIGDIRGISYIYPLFWKFGIIEVPEAAAQKMRGETEEG